MIQLRPARPITLTLRHPRLRVDRRAVLRALALLDAHQASILRAGGKAPTGELSIVFLSDSALAQLHGEFLADPSTTDVITFEGDPAFGSAGEICVSADTAAAYARDHGTDFSTELTLYLVHGWLHLAGYDDLTPEKKRAMRRAEARAMRRLAAENAIPRFTLRPGRARAASRRSA